MKTARLFLVVLVLLGFAVALFAEEAEQTARRFSSKTAHPAIGWWQYLIRVNPVKK